jgi:hypothetical protein
MPGSSSRRQPLTCNGAKSAKKAGKGMRRYGDGLFGGVFEELVCRARGKDGRDIGARETFNAFPFDDEGLASLAKLVDPLLMLDIEVFECSVKKSSRLVYEYPIFTPHHSVSGNSPDPGYLMTMRDSNLFISYQPILILWPTSPDLDDQHTPQPIHLNFTDQYRPGCESLLSSLSLSFHWLRLRLPLMPTSGLMSSSHPVMLRLARMARSTRWTAGAT